MPSRPRLLPAIVMLLHRGALASRMACPRSHSALPSLSALSPMLHRASFVSRSPAVAMVTEPIVPQLERQRVATLLKAGGDMIGQQVLVKGWVRTVRTQKTFSFVEVNDGSSLQGVQVIASNEMSSYDVVDSLTTGAAVHVVGILSESPAKGQSVELKATEVTLIGDCPADYPLQKKRHTLEFLRSIAHLRPRTNTIGAISRVRSALAYATHNYFQELGFK